MLKKMNVKINLIIIVIIAAFLILTKCSLFFPAYFEPPVSAEDRDNKNKAASQDNLSASSEISFSLISSAESSSSNNFSIFSSETAVSSSSNLPLAPSIYVTWYYGDININSNHTYMPSGAYYDFGTFNLGESKNVTFCLMNYGNAPLTVENFISNSPELEVQCAVPFTRDPGNGVGFNVRYTPNSGGNKTAGFTVISNDPNIPSYAINFSAKVIYPVSGSSDFNSAGNYSWNPSNLGLGSLSTINASFSVLGGSGGDYEDQRGAPPLPWGDDGNNASESNGSQGLNVNEDYQVQVGNGGSGKNAGYIGPGGNGGSADNGGESYFRGSNINITSGGGSGGSFGDASLGNTGSGSGNSGYVRISWTAWIIP